MTMTNERPARPRPRLRTVEVKKEYRANPRLVRVTVTGPDLGRYLAHPVLGGTSRSFFHPKVKTCRCFP